MNNEQKLKSIFAEALGVSEEKITKRLQSNESTEWDSVAHMNLISGIEDGFEIELEDDDLFAMVSWNTTKEIVGKYGISF